MYSTSLTIDTIHTIQYSQKQTFHLQWKTSQLRSCNCFDSIPTTMSKRYFPNFAIIVQVNTQTTLFHAARLQPPLRSVKASKAPIETSEIAIYNSGHEHRDKIGFLKTPVLENGLVMAFSTTMGRRRPPATNRDPLAPITSYSVYGECWCVVWICAMHFLTFNALKTRSIIQAGLLACLLCASTWVCLVCEIFRDFPPREWGIGLN